MRLQIEAGRHANPRSGDAVPQCRAVPLLAALALLVSCGGAVPPQAGGPAVTRQLSLNGSWRFRTDRDDVGVKQGWFAQDAPSDTWDDITVPGNWNFLFRTSPYPDSASDYDGIAWYRSTFDVAAALDTCFLRLHFGAGSYKTTIWLNGSRVGEHEGDFLPFEFDVTHLLHYGQPNTLALRVEAISANSVETVPPATGRYDYWIYSGIHREVYLEAVSRVSIYDVFVHAEPDRDRAARVHAEIQLANVGEDPARVGMRFIIRDRAAPAAAVATRSVVTQVNASSLVTLVVDALIDGPQLWSVETPHLYDCEVELAEPTAPIEIVNLETRPFDRGAELPPHATLTRLDRNLLDAVSVAFGIRKVEARHSQILVNGAPVTFRGINRHDEYPLLGRTLPDAIYESDLITLKRAGVNAIRTAHYPNDPRIYDLADRMGFFVIEEVPCTGLNADEMRAPPVQALALAHADAMVRRDRNHPSIVLWSAGNEPWPVGNSAFNARQYDVMKTADPTRLVSYARVLFDNQTPDEASDVVMLNPYFGWYVGQINALDQFLEQTHRRFPDKPIILSEFGADAIKDDRSNAPADSSPRFSEDYQAYYLNETWKIVRSKDYVSGGFIWVFADFLSPTRKYLRSQSTPPMTPNPLPYHNLKGIVTNDRVPKNSYLTTLGMFHDTPLYSMTIHVTAADGTPIHGATVDLALADGTWCAHQLTDEDGKVVLWLVPPQAYTLRATHGNMEAQRTFSFVGDDVVSVTLSAATPFRS